MKQFVSQIKHNKREKRSPKTSKGEEENPEKIRQMEPTGLTKSANYLIKNRGPRHRTMSAASSSPLPPADSSSDINNVQCSLLNNCVCCWSPFFFLFFNPEGLLLPSEKCDRTLAGNKFWKGSQSPVYGFLGLWKKSAAANSTILSPLRLLSSHFSVLRLWATVWELCWLICEGGPRSQVRQTKELDPRIGPLISLILIQKLWRMRVSSVPEVISSGSLFISQFGVIQCNCFLLISCYDALDKQLALAWIQTRNTWGNMGCTLY